MDDLQTTRRVERVEALLEEVETLSDPVAREMATELVQALLDMYGEGLARDRRARRRRREALAEDELVSHLLLLHGLHPVPRRGAGAGGAGRGPAVPRVARRRRGAARVDDGVVRLRLEGSCSGCPSSTMTLKLAIEDAIHKAAPDVERIEAEGAAARRRPAASPG